jgi:DNA replication and repair protein RecF
VHVAALALADFRSYAAVELTLGPGITTFIGANGQGKTNLLEAIGYVATLESHRVATDAPLIREGAERALIRCLVERSDREILVELEITAGKANRARLNRSPLTRARDVLGTLHTVLFAPEDLALVKGDPSERRRFLDDLQTQLTPAYAGVRADYDRVVKQRTSLLRSAAQNARGSAREAAEATLDVWDDHLARLGAQILVSRLHLVEALQPLAAHSYADLAPTSQPFSMSYKSALGDDLVNDETQLAQGLRELALSRRKDELERGVTLVGPHRDDLLVAIGSMPVKGYASHGESWSAALALRLASYDVLRAAGSHEGDPVLLLDDVFAELDTARRERLAERVATAEQVLLTAAVDADVPAVLAGRKIRVNAGEVFDVD